MVSFVIVVPMVPVAVVKVAKKVHRWVSEGHFCFELNCQEGPSSSLLYKIDGINKYANKISRMAVGGTIKCSQS